MSIPTMLNFGACSAFTFTFLHNVNIIIRQYLKREMVTKPPRLVWVASFAILPNSAAHQLDFPVRLTHDNPTAVGLSCSIGSIPELWSVCHLASCGRRNALLITSLLTENLVRFGVILFGVSELQRIVTPKRHIYDMSATNQS